MTRNPITDGQTVLAPLFGSILNAHGAEAILNGVAPSVGGGNWDVDTTSGDVFINGTTTAVGSNTESLTAPSSDPDLDSGEFRVDLLTVNSSGTINVAEGVAASQPISGDIPADEAVICAVLVSADAGSLTSADIRDYRTLLEDDAARYKDGGPHEIDVAEFAAGQGTAGQRLESDGSAASWVTKRQYDATHTFMLGGADVVPTGSTFAEPNFTSRMRSFNFAPYSDGEAGFALDTDSSSGTAEIRIRDTTNNNTVASASTTSDTTVRLSDTTVSLPSGDATLIVEVRNTDGNQVNPVVADLTVYA